MKKFNKKQEEFLKKTDECMANMGLKDREDYAVGVKEETDLRSMKKTITLLIQFQHNPEISKILRELGWRHKYTFYNETSSPNCIYDGDSKNNYGKYKMVQMAYLWS